MADVPHQGPNLSRMPLEGTGGLIIAALPAFCLLLVTPVGFALWVAAGALAAPLIYWANHRAQDRSNLGGGVVAASLGLLFASLLALPTLRGALLPWAAACLVAAAVLHGRSLSDARPSIRSRA